MDSHHLPALRTIAHPSDTAIVLPCFVPANKSHVCQTTAQRWEAFAAWHRYDIFVLTQPSGFWEHDSRRAASWDKVAAAIELLSRRPYLWALVVDGDSVPWRWSLSVPDLVSRSARWCAVASSGCSIWISRDVGHFGALRPPAGPLNSGVMLFRRDAAALELL